MLFSGMKHLLRTFLTDLGGDPNKRNAFDETVLHSSCSAGTAFPPTINHISISCVQLSGSGSSITCSNNGNNQTEATGSGALTASAQERRAACIALLLQWRGVRLPSSDEKERIQMDALDRVNFLSNSRKIYYRFVHMFVDYWLNVCNLTLLSMAYYWSNQWQK